MMRRAAVVSHLCAALAMVALARSARGQSGAFTYQGLLKSGGSSVNGAVDMQYSVWNAPNAGTQIGPTLTFDGIGGNPPQVNVVDGLFTVQLNFGAGVFTGQSRWLEIAVRQPPAAYATLSPRQELTPTPYAITAQKVETPLSLTNSLSGAAVVRVQNDSQTSNSVGVEGVAAGGTGATIGVRGESTSLNGKGVFGLANYAFGGTPSGVYGQSNTEGGRGVTGVAAHANGNGSGGYFESAGVNGAGVFGRATDTEGEPFPLNFGVRGEALGLFGRGVYGAATNTGGGNHGGYFECFGSSGIGVEGVAVASGGTNYGVFGRTNSPTGYAGYFAGRGYFGGNVGIGTLAPVDKLDVNGVIRASAGGVRYPDGTLQTSASRWLNTGDDTYFAGSNLGLGTAAPSAALHINRPNDAVAIRLQTAQTLAGPPTSQTRTAIAVVATGSGQPWISPSNAIASDDQWASTNLAESSVNPDTDLSAALEWTGFDFTLPGTAQVTGIVAVIEGRRACSCACDLCQVRITVDLLGGASASRSFTTNLGDNDFGWTFGQSHQLWNTGWTAASVNSSAFGVRLVADLELLATGCCILGSLVSFPCDCDGSGTAQIDSVSVTVHYYDSAVPSTPVDWSIGVGASDPALMIAPTADLSTPAIAVSTSGRVGIGTTNPQTFTLTVNGEAAKPGGGSWALFSDARMKREIKPMRGTLDKLLCLRGYEFEYAHEAVANRLCLPGRQIGLLAEEVECVFPDWVERDAEGYRCVTERATTALLVEALRDLRSEKDAQLAARDAQIADLMTRLERLEAAMRPPAGRGKEVAR